MYKYNNILLEFDGGGKSGFDVEIIGINTNKKNKSSKPCFSINT